MKTAAKYIIILFFLSAFSFNLFSQDDRHEKFQKGVSEYSSGNFRSALDYWLDLYNSGYRSGNLDYNIGNAYFKLSDIPRAILFYERAYLLDPSDENIRYNLEIARTLTVDKFQAIPELLFSKWFDFVSLFLHVNTWAAISIISFILMLGCLSLYIYSSGYKVKVTGFWLGVVFLVFSGISVMFSLHNKKLLFDSRKAIITTPVVSGKSSPDTSGTDLFVLHEGTKVSIGDEVGQWYEITLSDGNKGWVPVNSLDII